MAEIEIFKNEEFGEIRIIIIDDEPWFIGKEVADALGYKNTRDALFKHVSEYDRNTVAIRDGIKGNPNKVVINESGLYTLILSSKLESAKRFKHWVTSEVLPSIRKHGVYMTPAKVYEFLSSPDTLIELLQTLKKEQEQNKELKTVNAALTEQAHEWDDKLILNALVRSYASQYYNGLYGAAWRDFYKNLLYHEHINLKIRQGRASDEERKKKKNLIDYIEENEFPCVIKVAVAMCEQVGINTSKVINEVNAKKVNETY